MGHYRSLDGSETWSAFHTDEELEAEHKEFEAKCAAELPGRIERGRKLSDVEQTEQLPEELSCSPESMRCRRIAVVAHDIVCHVARDRKGWLRRQMLLLISSSRKAGGSLVGITTSSVMAARSTPKPPPWRLKLFGRVCLILEACVATPSRHIHEWLSRTDPDRARKSIARKRRLLRSFEIRLSGRT